MEIDFSQIEPFVKTIGSVPDCPLTGNSAWSEADLLVPLRLLDRGGHRGLERERRKSARGSGRYLSLGMAELLCMLAGP